MERVDSIVVGAGVVGLATARALAGAGQDTLLLEAAPRIGAGVSARSSEVVHAGLYYPAGSLKARLCVAGRHRLYEFCSTHGVPHRRTGKLVVATAPAQFAALRAIEASARAAGVDDLRWLEPSQARELEPQLDCAAALLSPSSGIVDSQALMLALLGAAQSHGATLACGTTVQRVTRAASRWHVHCFDAAGSAVVVEARWLVNAAGLGAQALAAAIDALPASLLPPRFLAKGHYFAYAGRVPFRHLVYPVPEPGGLGTHLTLDLAGRARFGPDVEWVEAEDYAVDATRRAAFAAAARRFWPALDPARLEPAYAGIRPKIVGPGEPAADFLVAGPEAHGLEGLVNLFGIESPGLTSALALADEVVARLAHA
ncbi:MAG: NAD(P)/FAD-dependent oxidoreductase [Steroidobacteraceae bacterium]|jgi:L-2-hydroxyglutarate oxidase LhgO|nr:NAD(P)/FAD-dependent oxidoreductase [Steroidobacteraceae bacterium]